MKRLFWCIFLLSFASGCATPLIIDNGYQRRVFIPCDNDDLCFRDTYNVAWDNGCKYNCRDYPVSYRTKLSEYQSNKTEYILLPKSKAPAIIHHLLGIADSTVMGAIDLVPGINTHPVVAEQVQCGGM